VCVCVCVCVYISAGMTMAMRLVFGSTHHRFGDGEHVGELSDSNDTGDATVISAGKFERFVIYLVAVFSELVTFIAALTAGCMFAATADSVDNVIRSTVSVMFVLNVDEIVFDSCCPGKIKDDVGETEYLIPIVKIKEGTANLLMYYYVLYFHQLVLLSLSSVLVFGLR
jgi:hypothetical protein